MLTRPSDEILYNAHMHPEQYSNTLSAAQISQLHRSIHYVCGLAVETLADLSKFPEEWLFKHRWAKGKKDAPTTLPNGSKFIFLRVGGRTSAVVPSVQKKTGPVKKDVDADAEEDGLDAEEDKPKSAAKKGAKRKKAAAANEDEVDGEQAEVKPAIKKSRGKKSSTLTEKESQEADAQEKPEATAKVPRRKKDSMKEEEQLEGHETVNAVDNDEKEDSAKPTSKKQKITAKPQANGKSTDLQRQKKAKATPIREELSGHRRSGRVSGKGVS